MDGGRESINLIILLLYDGLAAVAAAAALW